MADETNAQIGADSELSYWDTTVSPDAYTPIGAVRSISGVGAMRPEVDSTTLDSDAVERIPGLKDGKEVSVVITVNSTSLALIKGWVDAATEIDFELAIPEPTDDELYFTAVPLDWEISQITPNGLMEVTFKGRITGDISETDPHGI